MNDHWDYFFYEADTFIMEGKDLHVNIVSRINLIKSNAGSQPYTIEYLIGPN